MSLMSDQVNKNQHQRDIKCPNAKAKKMAKTEIEMTTETNTEPQLIPNINIKQYLCTNKKQNEEDLAGSGF